jgi:peptidyl-prolyl cis-trans isomerase D
MAMMISKFHRLIQSKVLWGIFAIVISIAMVGLFSDVPNIQQTNAEAASVGTLDGNPVPYEEFQDAYAKTRLQAALAFGQALPRTDEVEERLRELAWKRVITLRQIRELNIQVSDAEVLAGIQQQGMFRNQNGQFDARVYAGFLNRFLQQQMGIGQKQFEAYMREELAVTKFQALVAQSILISPIELRRAFQTVTDEFAIDFIEIPKGSIPEEPATSEEAEKYYNENPELFRAPEKAVVKYAAFSIIDAMEKVTLTDEDLLAFYNENIDRYQIDPAPPEELPEADETADEEDTAEESLPEADLPEGDVANESPDEEAAIEENSLAEAPMADEAASPAELATDEMPEVLDLTLPAGEETESAKLLDSTLPELSSVPDVPEVLYKDFEDVKSEISELLRREKARLFAGEAATDFVLSVQDAAYGGESFTDHAAKVGVALASLPPFTRQEIPEGIDAGASFTRDAFDLGTNLTDSFSDPIDGRDTIYVLSLQEKIPSVIPGFPDVKEEAISNASKQKAADALVEFSESLKQGFADQLSKGEDFSKLAEAQGYTVTSLEEITAATGIQNSPYENILFRGFLSRNQGELTDLLPADDLILLAYVRERAPAPAQSFTDYRPRIISNLVRERTQRVFSAFQDHLLDEASFSEKQDEEDRIGQSSSS